MSPDDLDADTLTVLALLALAVIITLASLDGRPAW